MAGRRDKPEDIVSKLRQVEVLQGQGMTIADAARNRGIPMIIKSLLAASIVASTLIGATAPASALIGVAIIAANENAIIAIIAASPVATAGSSVRDDKPSRSRDKKQKRGSKKHR